MKNVFTSQLVIRIISIFDNLIKLLLLFQSDEVSPPDAPRIKTFEGNHSETVIFIAFIDFTRTSRLKATANKIMQFLS